MHLLLYFFFLLSFFRLQPPGEACTDQMSFSWKRDLHLLVGAGIWRGAAHHIRPVLPQRKVGGGTRRLSRFRLVLFWVELTLRGKRRKKKNKLSVRCSSTFHFVKNVTNDENVSCHSVTSGKKNRAWHRHGSCSNNPMRCLYIPKVGTGSGLPAGLVALRAADTCKRIKIAATQVAPSVPALSGFKTV